MEIVDIIAQYAPTADIVQVWELAGGVSSQTIGVDIQHTDSTIEHLVIRSQQPSVINMEAKLLPIIAHTDIPVPIIRQVGNTYLLVDYVDGTTLFEANLVADYPQKMAQMLAKIHQIDYDWDNISFLNRPDMQYSTIELSSDYLVAHHMLQSDWQASHNNNNYLLHGDFWSGNVLWRDGEIVAVIDWEDSSVGDPLADLANSRREILWFFGVDAMRQFTENYRALMPPLDYSNLPYWDLLQSLKVANQFQHWGLDDKIEQRFQQRLDWFVADTIERIKT